MKTKVEFELNLSSHSEGISDSQNNVLDLSRVRRGGDTALSYMAGWLSSSDIRRDMSTIEIIGVTVCV